MLWEKELVVLQSVRIKANLFCATEKNTSFSFNHTDLIGFGVIALAGGGSLGWGPSRSPTTVTATGLCSLDIRSVLPLRDVEPDRLNIPDRRPRKSFLLDRISLATLISESDP